MGGGRDSGVLGAIQFLFQEGTLLGLDDAQLLERFLAGESAAADSAFEALVARHGPMVFAVCRQLLRDSHDAQDAFQATFFILARRAGAIRQRDSLASWLFGVARKVASRARTNAAHRRAAEQAAAQDQPTRPRSPADLGDLEALYQEIDRLPTRERDPVVLCDLEGMTYEAAARQLGCPLGTLSVRLKRARERLRSRLTRRGLAIPSAMPFPTPVPAGLAELTIRTAGHIFFNRTTAAVAVSAAVNSLTTRTITMMRYQMLGIGAAALATALGIGTIGLGLVGLAASVLPTVQAPTPAPSATTRPVVAPVDAAALVRAIRDQEGWIDRVQSLWIKAEVTWERTPQWIARRRQQIEKEAARDPVQRDRSAELQPRSEQRVEVAFDQRRARIWDRWPWGVEDLSVWDGKRHVNLKFHERTPRDKTAGITRTLGSRFNMEADFASFRTATHPFWWISPAEQAKLAQSIGKPEEFAAAGRERFGATECEVVCRWGKWDRYYFAAGRLRGIKVGAQPTPDLVARQLAFFQGEGHPFRDEAEYAAWFKNLTPEESRQVHLKLSANMLRLTEPIVEFGLEDYREVAPGCWFPMKQTTTILTLDENGKNTVDLTKVLQVTSVQVNLPLPDELFQVEFPDGTHVIDQTTNPPLSYRQKAAMTPEEWAKIVASGKERARRDQQRQAQDAALIGRAAPEFPIDATWLGGPPLRWADLAGQVVVLDFWAEWCVPCRSDLPTLSGLHQNRAKNGLTIIGVHPPGSEPAVLDQHRRAFQLDYPVCVDVPGPAGVASWGRLFEQFHVDQIPRAALVDRQGKVVAIGEPNEILIQASRASRPAP